MNYFAKKFSDWDKANRLLVKEYESYQKRLANNAATKERMEAWKRDNIVAELRFVKKQRELWMAMLEEAKKNGDAEMIYRKERDLKRNARILVELQMIYISVRNEKKAKISKMMADQELER